MNKFIAILVIFSLCLAVGLSFNPRFGEKFCDKSLTDDQISQMESCEQYMPPQVKANTDKCLQQLGVGTAFKDFRNTVCDKNTQKQFHDCIRDNIKAQRKAAGDGSPPPKPDGMFKQHADCMKKATGN